MKIDIIRLLRSEGHPLSLEEISNRLDINYGTLSVQLSQLRLSGIVQAEKDLVNRKRNKYFIREIRIINVGGLNGRK